MTSIIIMVNTVNFNFNFIIDMVNKRLASPNHHNFFPRILILVQNILIYLLEIVNTILQGWRHCTLHIRNRLWPHDVTSFQSGIRNTL